MKPDPKKSIGTCIFLAVNPLFPALQTGPTAVSGPPAKSKFLAAMRRRASRARAVNPKLATPLPEDVTVVFDMDAMNFS
jgi:hypothetical protein